MLSFSPLILSPLPAGVTAKLGAGIAGLKHLPALLAGIGFDGAHSPERLAWFHCFSKNKAPCGAGWLIINPSGILECRDELFSVPVLNNLRPQKGQGCNRLPAIGNPNGTHIGAPGHLFDAGQFAEGGEGGFNAGHGGLRFGLFVYVEARITALRNCVNNYYA